MILFHTTLFAGALARALLRCVETVARLGRPWGRRGRRELMPRKEAKR